MKIVIIGGVAGGATAAARIRRLDEEAEIIMLERSGFVSYANCGLPYYLSGVIADQEDLTLQTPESFWRRFRVEVRVRHEATAIDTGHKTVTVKELETGRVYQESYDKLLLSPGAKPVWPPLAGIGSGRIFPLRTVEDTLRLRGFLDREKPKTAVVAGGGFIGIETAENLAEAGVSVTMVQMQEQLMTPLDYEMACFVHAKMRQHGVRLLLGQAVEGFTEEENAVLVHAAGGETLRADLVVMAIGVSPDSGLAAEAGLKLGVRGSILVNDRMETSAPDVYAVGDAVEVRNFVSGERTLISLAGPANRQGRIAADNICGGDSRYPGSQGSSVIKVFDLTAASTGLNETAARAAGYHCGAVWLSPASHASYYPGAQVMTMKVVYEKGTRKLLGAQIVGRDGADKRLDVLAAAIRAGMDAVELKDLDLAYAPPYSSAKDPVNMAGFMIENLETGKVKQFGWNELSNLPRDGSATLVDVRTPAEYARGHVEGFVNIPIDDLRGRLGEIPAGKPVFLLCQSALRSYIACRILTQHGYECSHLAGGYRLYETVHAERCAADEAFPCGMEKCGGGK